METTVYKKNEIYDKSKLCIILILTCIMIMCNEPAQVERPIMKEPQPGEIPILIVTPSNITINTDKFNYALNVKSSCSSSLQWQITSYPKWLIPNETSGTADSSVKKITFLSNLNYANFGQNDSFIVLRSNGESIVINVSAQKYVYPGSLEFSNENNTIQVYYYWKVQSYYKYLYVFHKSNWLKCKKDTIYNNSSIKLVDTLDFSVDFSSLQKGTYYDTLELVSSLDREIRLVPVTLKITEQAKIHFVDSTLYLDRIRNSINTIIYNSGNVSASWKILPVTGISLSAETGTLTAGQKDTVTIGFDSTKIKDTLVNISLNISGGGSNNTLNLIVKNNHEDFNSLNQVICGAAYSRRKNLIATIDNSSRLFIINPDSINNPVSINLPRKPLCLCASIDGKWAAVGHDGFVSLINLETRSLESILTTSYQANDIAMSDSIIYVFPLGDQWMLLHAINIFNKTEYATSASIYSGSSGGVNPISKSIYCTRNGTELSKFKIISDTISNYYHPGFYLSKARSYIAGQDFWFTEDGSYLIGSSTAIFRCSDEKSTDLTNTGTLQSSKFKLYPLSWIDDHKKSGYLYIVSATNADMIIRFSDQLFNEGGSFTIPLQLIYSAGKMVSTKVQSGYIFVNDSGDKMYVLAASASEPTSVWLLGTIDTRRFK